VSASTSTDSAKATIHIPIICMTGHGEFPDWEGKKGGAVDFLTKTVATREHADAVVMAIERDRKRREVENVVASLKRPCRDPDPPRAGRFMAVALPAS